MEPADETHRLWEAFMLVKDANNGDPTAQHELGIRYILGRGFPADTAKAAFWIGKAATQNVIPARFNLGILQNNGWGMPWNPFEAFLNFQYAAEREMTDARYALGMMYLDNLVVPRNEHESFRWISMAADSGYTPAAEALQEFRKRGITAGQESSSVLTQKAAQYDSANAVIAAPPPPSSGLIFLDFSTDTNRRVDDSRLIEDVIRSGSDELKHILGLTTIADTNTVLDTTVVRHLRESGERGSLEALALLGRCYERGVGVRPDTVAATVYYLRAYRLESPLAAELLWRLSRSSGYFDLLKREIDGGSPDAMYAWAGLVGAGFDYQLSTDQAFHLLQRAIERGHPHAMIEAGLQYSTGRGVKTDRDEARRLWRKAAALGNQEARLRLALAAILDGGIAERSDSLIPQLREAVHNGSILAEIALAVCFEQGVLIAENTGEAVRLYRAAATRGSQIAYRALQRLYDTRRPPDPRFQVVW